MYDLLPPAIEPEDGTKDTGWDEMKKRPTTTAYVIQQQRRMEAKARKKHNVYQRQKINGKNQVHWAAYIEKGIAYTSGGEMGYQNTKFWGMSLERSGSYFAFTSCFFACFSKQGSSFWIYCIA